METENGQRELRPRFMPQREATKKVKGDVPESVADDFEQYCKFVAEAAGVKPEAVAGDVLAAALKDFMKADKSFPKWKAKQLEDVSSDEVEEALSGLGAGAPQETPRPAERAASSSSASSSGGGAAASGGGRAGTGRGSADAGRTTSAPTPAPAARTPASPPPQT
ncbi:MAG TPA: hypothetical protein VFS10_17735 [Pyrinomonadaceae bacterium]|nr:hypothetical protein [Pyrinomonadaceae bacterium]